MGSKVDSYDNDDEICNEILPQMSVEIRTGHHGNVRYFCLIVTKI